MPLGDIINRARLNKRLGLRAFARLVDIAPSYLSDIENDRRVPSEAVLRKIVDILDLDFDDLMHQAGRLGEEAENYLRREKLAGQLFRRVANSRLDQEALQKLLKNIQKLELEEEEDEGTP